MYQQMFKEEVARWYNVPMSAVDQSYERWGAIWRNYEFDKLRNNHDWPDEWAIDAQLNRPRLPQSHGQYDALERKLKEGGVL